MALVFQRLARNFAKNGYYPTDAATIEGILRLLKQPDSGTETQSSKPQITRIIDPCCGEGTALAELSNHLCNSISYGIELNEERAWHAKNILNTVIHGDLNDCLVGKRQFSLMFFNPPYGDLVADKAGYSEKKHGRARLEKQFYQMTNQYLQFGGIGITIILQYSLDRYLSTWIASHYSDVQVFKAAVDTFKQIVIIGKRQRADSADVQLKSWLERIGSGNETPPELPDENDDVESYVVPGTVDSKLRFMYVKIEPRQLLAEINKHPVLWEGFDMHFGNTGHVKRRPLRKMTDWHMALMLAAGYINGLVTSNDGKSTYLIKGDTHKKKEVKVTYSDSVNKNGDHDTTKITTATDKFVPVIRAIDFTPGPGYGRLLTIK